MVKHVALSLALAGCASALSPPGTRDITDGIRHAARNGDGYELRSNNSGTIECLCVFDSEDNPPHADTPRLLSRLRQECSGRTDPSLYSPLEMSLYSPMPLSSSQGLFVIFSQDRGSPLVEYQVFDLGEGRGSITTLWAADCSQGRQGTIRRVGDNYRYEVR